MDDGHVSVQIISALPGMSSAQTAESCRAANDELSAAVRAHPDRLRGFAALHMGSPEGAAEELGRAVGELGLVGAMVDDHLVDGSQYDGAPYDVVWETAERLGVPVYIHPAPPTETAMAGRFRGDYAVRVALGLATGAHGWHADVGLHVLKLYAAGVFERFPRLKVVIGHNGEMLPIWIDRIDRLEFFRRSGLPKFSEVWERDIWVTTSGLFSVRGFRMLLLTTKIERLMYSVDSPFESSARGWQFVEELAESGVLTSEELEMFLHGNAKSLLRI